MPQHQHFKLWSEARSRRWLRAGDYPGVARRAVREMHRQVGPLRTDGRGLATRGVLVRHLVMPGAPDETREDFAPRRSGSGPGRTPRHGPSLLGGSSTLSSGSSSST